MRGQMLSEAGQGGREIAHFNQLLCQRLCGAVVDMDHLST